MKKKLFIWLSVMGVFIAISYFWGVLWNRIYCNGAKTFFLSNRVNDIKATLWASINEEFIWRLLPLLIISYVLYLLNYESSKCKKYGLCSIFFIMILSIQILFGIAHFSRIYETSDWMIKHVVVQGTMGLFYAIAYNIIQYYGKRIYKLNLIYSHLTAYLSSTTIHAIVNILLIINLTF